jgi:hypothetical protein
MTIDTIDQKTVAGLVEAGAVRSAHANPRKQADMARWSG